MKHLLLPILLVALVAPAAAQSDAPGDPLHPAMEAARHAVINFLDLDQAQVESWDTLWADHRAAEEPLHQQIADVQAQIDDLFATGSPDPAELGLLIIERRDLGDALVDVHVIYVEGFQSLLDEEQSRSLGEIRIAERIERWIPAFTALELVKR